MGTTRTLRVWRHLLLSGRGCGRVQPIAMLASPVSTAPKAASPGGACSTWQASAIRLGAHCSPEDLTSPGCTPRVPSAQHTCSTGRARPHLEQVCAPRCAPHLAHSCEAARRATPALGWSATCVYIERRCSKCACMHACVSMPCCTLPCRITRMHVCTHARTHARMHTRTHARTHAHARACTQARAHARTHARTHACTHGTLTEPPTCSPARPRCAARSGSSAATACEASARKQKRACCGSVAALRAVIFRIGP